MNRIERLNEDAVAKGLLAPDNTSSRGDFSSVLGEDLSLLELRCYCFIHQMSFDGPVSPEQIYKGVYQAGPADKDDIRLVEALVHRIKKKLGCEAIITRVGVGYLSRRAMDELRRNK